MPGWVAFLQHGLSTDWLFLRSSIPLVSGCLLWLSLASFPWSLCGPPLHLGFPPIELWDSLSSLVNSGIACLASQSFDWPDALWASLSSVWLSVTLVKLSVIGYCWGGTFNCPASACWLIDLCSGTIIHSALFVVNTFLTRTGFMNY